MTQLESPALCPECGNDTVTRENICNHCGASVSDEKRRGAYFPLQYFVDFLRYLAQRPDQYQIITYDDLSWSSHETYPPDYRSEYRSWRNKVANSAIDQKKIHVLLQHDVDSRPERTFALLEREAELGTPSNVMIFSRRIDRKRLKHAGVLEETEYQLDHTYLASLEREQRFVVGYHSNAYERALFDEEQAYAMFEADVAELRRHHAIKYFSPHGGVAGPDGRNNHSLDIPQSLRGDITWVHNRNSVIFDGNYSDGGINNKNRDPEPRNLIAFVRSWKPGHRYRILTHPQYYHDVFRDAPVLSQSNWYQAVMEHYASTPDVSFWEKVLG